MIRFASGGDCGGSSACAGDAFDEVHRLTLPNSNNSLYKTIKNKYEYFYSYVVARIAPERVAAPTPPVSLLLSGQQRGAPERLGRGAESAASWPN